MTNLRILIDILFLRFSMWRKSEMLKLEEKLFTKPTIISLFHLKEPAYPPKLACSPFLFPKAPESFLNLGIVTTNKVPKVTKRSSPLPTLTACCTIPLLSVSSPTLTSHMTLSVLLIQLWSSIHKGRKIHNVVMPYLLSSFRCV